MDKHRAKLKTHRPYCRYRYMLISVYTLRFWNSDFPFQISPMVIQCTSPDSIIWIKLLIWTPWNLACNTRPNYRRCEPRTHRLSHLPLLSPTATSEILLSFQTKSYRTDPFSKFTLRMYHKWLLSQEWTLITESLFPACFVYLQWRNCRRCACSK